MDLFFQPRAVGSHRARLATAPEFLATCLGKLEASPDIVERAVERIGQRAKLMRASWTPAKRCDQ